MMPRLVALVGPTASGKSALAMRLAERVGGVIVSADAGQVYRRFDVGTAKPTAEERGRVPHFALDIVEPTEACDVARWSRAAGDAIDRAHAGGRPVLVVGGTGLYVRALLGGLCAAPGRDTLLRRRLRNLRDAGAGQQLRRWLVRLDPPSAARIHPNDWVRTERALEVVLTTGRPISAWQAEHRFDDGAYEALVLVLDPAVHTLDERIASRASQMLGAGWVEEVAALTESVPADAPAWRTLGYGILREHVRGRIDREAARREIVLRTRQFAKRQRTWWRQDVPAARIVRIDPGGDPEATMTEAAAFLVAKRPRHG